MPKPKFDFNDIDRLVTENSGLGGIPPECYVGEPPNRLVRVWLFHEKEWRNVEPVDAREIIAQGFGNLIGPKA